MKISSRDSFKRLCIIALSAALILSMGGCWDDHELNTVGIVMGVGLDKAETPGDISMTSQIVTFAKTEPSTESKSQPGTGSSESPPYFNITEPGPDVHSILDKLTLTLDRNLYFAHNQIIVFGEALAKDGIRDSLDFFTRSYEPRMTVNIFVARGKASDVLDSLPYFEMIPASEIAALTKSTAGSINKPVVTMFDLFNGLLSKTTSAIIPMIEVTEKEERMQFQLSGCAVFKGDKQVGTLNTAETNGYQWVKNGVSNSIQNVTVNENQAGVHIKTSKGKIKPVKKDDGSIMIKVEIKTTGSLESKRGNIRFSEEGKLEQLKKETERSIKMDVEATVNKGRELSADILGLGEVVKGKFPEKWKELEPQWDEVLKNIEVEINVSAEIVSTGKIAAPLQPE